MWLLDKLIAKKVETFEKELLQKYYAEVESMYSKMRGWRHDYRHHIQTMKVHAARGEFAEVTGYLDTLDDDLTNVETVIKTGNRMADAILNSKLSAAAEKNIQVKAEAKIPVTLGISELDLCIVLANLLDNAIEACAELPDEPTAALDPIAEAEIYQKFDEIVGDKTAIYISHRLSSCRFCDKIAVFHQGEIVQLGTHEELLADKTGKYYELWNAQAQYYVEKSA